MKTSSNLDMACNVFKYCTVLRALSSIMIFVVFGIIGLSYYAVVVANYGPALFLGGLHSITALFVLFLFHALLVMLVWSYFSVVITDPGGVPPNWIPKLDEERGDASPWAGSDNGGVDLGLYQSATLIEPKNQGIRFCQKCSQFKPPRCHHCSVCWRCILKMDHHCVWVVNCVGAYNYKYFILFLFYTFLETTLVTVTLLPIFIALFTDDEIPGSPGNIAASFITFVLNLAFALSILGFLIMHIRWLQAILPLLRSRITFMISNFLFRAFEKKNSLKWCYDLGWKINFEQVFGKNKKYWLIPVHSKDDLEWMPSFQCIEYPTRVG